LCILCGVILLAALVENARCFWFRDSIGWGSGRRFGVISASHGRLNFTFSEWLSHRFPTRISFNSASTSNGLPHWERVDESYNRRRWMGFEWTDSLSPDSDSKVVVFYEIPSYRLIAVPFWAIALLATMPLAWPWVAARRRRGRISGQLCPECGYDLRATPDRCPECGTALSPAIKSSQIPAASM
jgi:hypothetical protein